MTFGHAKAIFWLICLLYLPSVLCHSMKDAKSLLADKLSDYEKTFRPIANQSAPMVLHIALELVSIQDFDEVQEKLTVTAVVVLNWVDEYMQWNPDDYGGMTQLVMESDKVWTPNLVLTNNFDKLKKIGDAWQVIRFTSDGFGYYYPGDVLSASCRVDVTYYPWDRHRCGFSFSAWAHSSSEVVFLPSEDKVLKNFFSENGAWTFFNSSVETSYEKSFIEFYLHLERKPRFVLVNVIIPIVFMAFLGLLIFVIPVESGERISYSMTVLLAIAVFLTLVGDNLPKTSSPMSIFSYYLLTVLILSICITLATIFNVRLYYTSDSEPVTRCLANFARAMKCRRIKQDHRRKKTSTRTYQGINRKNKGLRCTRKNENLVQNNIHQTNVPTAYGGSAFPGMNELHLSKSSTQFMDVLEEVKSRQSKQQNRFTVDLSVSWKDVSAAFDRAFFVVSVLILTIATTIFFLYIFFSHRS